MWHRYRALWKTSGAPPLMVFGVLARVPLSLSSVGLLLLVQQQTGSLAQAGVVAGLNALGAGLTGLMQGPLYDRCGVRTVLQWLAPATAIALLALLASIQVGLPLWQVGALSGLAGFLRPHSTTCTRMMWQPLLGTESALAVRASAWESVVPTVLGIVGPAAVAVATPAGMLLPLLVVGACCGLLGQLGLAGLPAAAALSGIRGQRSPSALLRLLPLLVLVGVSGVCGGMVLLGLTGTVGSRVGWIGAASGIGSVLGGLLYGSFPLKTERGRLLALLLMLEALGTLAMFLLVGWLPGLLLCAALFGALLSPQTSCQYELATRGSSEQQRATAFSLVATVGFVSSSLGQAAGGMLASALAQGVLLLAAGLLALCGVAGLLLRERLAPPARC